MFRPRVIPLLLLRGTGLVKTPLSMCIDVMRIIQLAAHRKLTKTLDLSVQLRGAALDMRVPCGSRPTPLRLRMRVTPASEILMP